MSGDWESPSSSRRPASASVTCAVPRDRVARAQRDAAGSGRHHRLAAGLHHGGDTSPILDAILETGTGYLCCPAETDQRRFMEKMRAHPEVTVRINMDPRPLVAGDTESIQMEVDRVLTLAQNRQHVCIGTGCLPFEVEPQTVLQTRQMVLSRTVQRIA